MRVPIKPTRIHYVTALVVAIAAALFALATEPWLGPSWRFRVIMVAILGDSLGVIWLLTKNFELIGELRSQHRAASYVTTMYGMVDVALGGEPLPEAARERVKAAIDEQFRLYDEALGGES